MNWLDILILVILAITTVFGFIRGLVRQVIGIGAVIGGLILALHEYDYISRIYDRFISEGACSRLLGFLTVFFFVVLLGWIISLLISRLMKGPLRLLNHFFGGIFGLIKGILVCTVIVFSILIFAENRKALRESRFSPYFIPLSKGLYSVLPQGLKKEFGEIQTKILRKGKKHEKRI